MQGAYFQWCKDVGGDCSLAALRAELTHENKSAIHNCCTGKSVRSGAYYYRQLHPDILLEMDDLDKLTLKEYDDLCGVN